MENEGGFDRTSAAGDESSYHVAVIPEESCFVKMRSSPAHKQIVDHHRRQSKAVDG